MLKFTGVQWGSTVEFLPGANYFSAVEKSAFIDILSEAAVHILRCLVQCTGK